MNPQVLGLHSEPLKEFRESLDEAIKLLTTNLTMKDLRNGTVTAKLKITLNQMDANGTPLDLTMMKIEPKIEVKIGASGKVECKTQDGIYMKYDEDGIPIIGDHQVSIDEYIRERMDRQTA